MNTDCACVIVIYLRRNKRSDNFQKKPNLWVILQPNLKFVPFNFFMNIALLDETLCLLLTELLLNGLFVLRFGKLFLKHFERNDQ